MNIVDLILLAALVCTNVILWDTRDKLRALYATVGALGERIAKAEG